MVKQIYDQETYDRIERERADRAYYIILPNENIKRWIDDGLFAHLKKELQAYHDLYFACQKQEDNRGCVYSFFFGNVMARNRFESMVDELFLDKKVRLVNCKPSEISDDKDDLYISSGITMSACPLF